MAQTLVMELAVAGISAGVSWSSMLTMGQRVCVYAYPLLQTNHQSVKLVLEELDLHCSIETIKDLAIDSIPQMELEGSWIVATPYRSSEERVAFYLVEILQQLEQALADIERKIKRYDKSWNYIFSLNLDMELANLRHLDTIFNKRKKLFFDALMIRNKYALLTKDK